MSKKSKVAPAERVSLSVAAEDELEPLQRLGDYQLIWQTGKDALSTTFAARRDGVEGILSMRLFERNADARRIQKAAKSAADLTHPNAVVVYDSGVTEDGAPYVVTDWIEGETLSEVLANSKRMQISRFLSVFMQVCEALNEAHSRQLIHGNLCPSKVVFAHNQDDLDLIKVIDFGMPPDPVQNAFYVSPDQWLDKAKVDARSDIYSLGCMMYEALVGTPPFVGHQKSSAALNYLHELASQYSPESPEHNALKLLDCIIIKCIQSNRNKRFSSVRELMDALNLVSECICEGSTKKLPRRAEKLLLFRFLDIFDKKIVSAMFIYILLGMVTYKFACEMNLQKYIDQGQLGVLTGNLSLAQADWNAAIHQAELAGKPPSLVADLHWELGDVYFKQSMESEAMNTAGGKDELARDAIEQYQLALNYFKHGAHFRSSTIGLLQNIGALYTSMDDSELRDKRETEVRNRVRKLFEGLQYAECARQAADYLQGADDADISSLAAQANLAQARKLPLQRKLRALERAVYFASGSESDSCQGALNDALDQHGMSWENSNARVFQATLALRAGDVEAARGTLSGQNILNGMAMDNAVESYVELLKVARQAIPLPGPALKNSVLALSQSLALEEEANGRHSPKLAPTMLRLAQCYLGAGEKRQALEAYRKALQGTPPEDTTMDGAALLYADLLSDAGHTRQATTFLEGRLRQPDGNINTHSPLYVRLIQSYAREGLTKSASFAVAQLTDGVEIEPLVGGQIIEVGHTQPSPDAVSQKGDDMLQPPPPPYPVYISDETVRPGILDPNISGLPSSSGIPGISGLPADLQVHDDSSPPSGAAWPPLPDKIDD